MFMRSQRFVRCVLNRVRNNLFCSEDLVVFDRRNTISELIHCEVLVIRTVERSRGDNCH